MADTLDMGTEGEDRGEVAMTEQRHRIEPDCSREEFLAVAKVYAREVVDNHDLTVSVSDLKWDVSDRAKRRAGAVTHRDGDPESVVLTWSQFDESGWAAAAATIRHELIHVHLLNEADDSTHGDRFSDLARKLETDVHCERFSDPEWWVVCKDCGTRLARYRRSKLVKHPIEYTCGECGGDFRVESND